MVWNSNCFILFLFFVCVCFVVVVVVVFVYGGGAFNVYILDRESSVCVMVWGFQLLLLFLGGRGGGVILNAKLYHSP